MAAKIEVTQPERIGRGDTHSHMLEGMDSGLSITMDSAFGWFSPCEVVIFVVKGAAWQRTREGDVGLAPFFSSAPLPPTVDEVTS